MTIVELYHELERHDWFHAMSDSAEVHERGDANWNRLMAEAGKIDGGVDLMMAYSKHVFSGQPWGTEKQPKPEMPDTFWICTEARPFDIDAAKAMGIVKVLHPVAVDGLCPVCKTPMNSDYV